MKSKIDSDLQNVYDWINECRSLRNSLERLSEDPAADIHDTMTGEKMTPEQLLDYAAAYESRAEWWGRQRILIETASS
jgi:MoaA/NifB/PqqE/SkfB family radical SAM enzyme